MTSEALALYAGKNLSSVIFPSPVLRQGGSLRRRRRRPKNDDGSFRSDCDDDGRSRGDYIRAPSGWLVAGRRSIRKLHMPSLIQPCFIDRVDIFYHRTGEKCFFVTLLRVGKGGCLLAAALSLSLRQLSGKRLDGDFPIWARFLGSSRPARGEGLDRLKYGFGRR